jgi:putative polyhydroxyalkanoate system protein
MAPMSSMDLEIPHHLGTEAARARIAGVTASIEKDFGAECRWDSETCLKVTRKGLQATLQVLEDRVKINLELGLFLRALGPSIRGGIAKRLGEVLT